MIIKLSNVFIWIMWIVALYAHLTPFSFLFMSTPADVATRGLDLAQESLREAKQELKEWETLFFKDKTKTIELLAEYRKDSETITRDAKVKECTVMVNEARESFNRFAPNNGNCN